VLSASASPKEVVEAAGPAGWQTASAAAWQVVQREQQPQPAVPTSPAPGVLSGPLLQPPQWAQSIVGLPADVADPPTAAPTAAQVRCSAAP
jgi:hypothetical protein